MAVLLAGLSYSTVEIPSGSGFPPQIFDSTDSPDNHRRPPMKLLIGTDANDIVLAEETGGTWKPNPNVVADLAKLLQGAKPEDFEMWVEEDE
jgi:hypothetical protein